MPTRTDQFTRRDALRSISLGAGAAAFTPFLNSTALAATGDQGAMPKRFVFAIKASGIDKENLVPKGVEVDFDRNVVRDRLVAVSLQDRGLPTILEPFDTLRDQLTVIQGLSGANFVGNHTAGYGALSCYRSERVPVAPTIDYLLGEKHSLGPYPMYGMALSEKLLNTSQSIADNYCYPNISAVKKNLAVPFQGSPAKAYLELFGSAVLGAKDVEKKMTLHTNLMDFLRNDAKRVQRKLSAAEKPRFESYLHALDTLRQREERKSDMIDAIRRHAPQYDDQIESESETARQQAHFEIATAALFSGLTNVVTLRLDTFSTKYRDLGINLNLHSLGHGGAGQNGWSSVEARRQIDAHHLRLIADMAEQLKSIPEGPGTMLDNTLIVYLSCFGGAHHAGQKDWPFVLVGGTGGKLKMGQYIQYPTYQQPGHKSIGNLYMSVMQAAGINYGEHFGEVDAGIRELDLQGPLSELLA